MTTAPSRSSGQSASVGSARPLGEILVIRGLLSPAQLEAALLEQQRTKRLLGSILIARGMITAPDLSAALATQFGLENAGEPRARRRRPRLSFGPLRLFRRLRRTETKPPTVQAAPEAGRRVDLQSRRDDSEASTPSVTTDAGPAKNSSLLFVPVPGEGYALLAVESAPPERGETMVVNGRTMRVLRRGPSPLPDDDRPCAFLECER